MAVRQPSKLVTWVRFPSPAPLTRRRGERRPWATNRPGLCGRPPGDKAARRDSGLRMDSCIPTRRTWLARPFAARKACHHTRRQLRQALQAIGSAALYASPRPWPRRGYALCLYRILCMRDSSCPGAWGVLAFDSDEANDWAYELDGARDLAPIDAACREVEASAGADLAQEVAVRGLAACEIDGSSSGQSRVHERRHRKVDRWVAAHPQSVSRELKDRAAGVIDRVLGQDSELLGLWIEAGEEEWLAAVADLRGRVAG